MRIKKLRLRNYKRFHDLIIDLGDSPKRVVALVGPNGCGKSSVFDGMLLLSSAHQPIGDQGRQKDWRYHSMDGETQATHKNIEVDFTTGPYVTVRQELAKSRKDNTIFSLRSPYRYNANLKINEKSAVPEISLNNYGASWASDLDGKMERSYRQLQAKYQAYMESTDSKPSEARAKIIGDINKSIKACLDIEIASIGNVENSQGTLYFSKPGQSAQFEFNVLSSGEKEVVDILLDLYLRKDHYTETIFLIDEPELHVNTSIQRNLLVEINNLIGKECQLWISTHSIGFLRALQAELKDDSEIIYFDDVQTLASKPRTLTPMQRTPAAWRSIFAVALDELTDLVSPKRIIYCEGRDQPGKLGEERGLDAQCYNTIFCGKHHETLFVSSGGSTELDQRSEIAFAVLSKALSQLEILVLKDRDMASGKVTTADDRRIYLENNPRSHRVLTRWEIENYLFDKEVLRAYSTKNGLDFNEEKYHSIVADPINGNVKDSIGAIRAACGIKTSISPDRFKLQLAACITPEMSIFRELEDSIFT